MSSGGGKAPRLPEPVPNPVEVDIKKAQSDISKRLKRSRGRNQSTAAGFLTTPPIVSDLALADVLG